MHLILTHLAVLMLAATGAHAPPWQVVADESRLTFTAIQQGAKFDGRFTDFSAEVHLDPDAAEGGHISAIIATGSVDTANAERDDYLRGEDWFDVKRWPHAEFETTSIEKQPDGSYIASARLTLRDQTRPVTMHFTLTQDKQDPSRWHLTGTVPIKRLDFGVGQGIWTDTTWVGDEVLVHVKLVLLRP